MSVANPSRGLVRVTEAGWQPATPRITKGLAERSAAYIRLGIREAVREDRRSR